jgi:hypothetical protein
MLIVKTTRQLIPELRTLITKTHSYNCPEVHPLAFNFLSIYSSAHSSMPYRCSCAGHRHAHLRWSRALFELDWRDRQSTFNILMRPSRALLACGGW